MQILGGFKTRSETLVFREPEEDQPAVTTAVGHIFCSAASMGAVEAGAAISRRVSVPLDSNMARIEAGGPG